MSELDLPYPSELKARIRDIEDALSFIDAKVKGSCSFDFSYFVKLLNDQKSNIERVIEDLDRIAEGEDCLDDLPFIKSKFGEGEEWLPAEYVPEFTRSYKFPLSTRSFKYFLAKSGNLQRYPRKGDLR